MQEAVRPGWMASSVCPANGVHMTPKTVSLGNYVYEELLKKICASDFSAGSRLPSESALAKSFGVSRPVVREALAQLREEGVIESRRGAGSFLVRTPQASLRDVTRIENWSDILHCYEYRAMLESRIALLAAQRATAEDIRRIRRCYERQKEEFFNGISAEGTDGEETSMDRDFEFHKSVAEATHNSFFVRSLEQLNLEMRRSMYLIIKLFESHKHRHYMIISEEHGRIVDAIESRNAELAEAAMKLHILNARDSLLPTQNTNEVQGLTQSPEPD